jgi:hypothetical protein
VQQVAVPLVGLLLPPLCVSLHLLDDLQLPLLLLLLLLS